MHWFLNTGFKRAAALYARCWVLGAASLLVVGTGPVMGQQSFEPSTSSWGGIGLIQTRNARFGSDGQMDFGAAYVLPYQRYFVNFRALSWVEGTFRYTISTDERFTQKRLDATITDRGADLKFPLLSEGKWTPAVAVGVQDLAGTGLFDAEYVVASRRYFDLDFSAGLAWGYLGTRGSLKNPLAQLSDVFVNRDEGFSGAGGIPEFGKLFGGERIAWFAGVEWLTPLEGMRVKLEYDGNDYTNEPVGGGDFFKSTTPINVGVEYRPWPWVTAGVTYERGSQLAARLAISTKFNDPIGVPKIADDPPRPISVRPREESNLEPPLSIMAQIDSPSRMTEVIFSTFDREGVAIDEVRFGDSHLVILIDAKPNHIDQVLMPIGRDVLRRLPSSFNSLSISLSEVGEGQSSVVIVDRADLFTRPVILVSDHIDGTLLRERLEEEGIELIAHEQDGSELLIYFSQRSHRYLAKAIGRAARVASEIAPASVEVFSFVNVSNGVATNSISLMRKDFEDVAQSRGSAEEIWHKAVLRPPEGIPETAIYGQAAYPDFNWYVTPKLRQHLGRPGQFYRYQVWMKFAAATEITRGLFLDSVLGANIYNDFDDLESIPDSRIPHVRSEIVNYLKKGENNLVRLSLSYIASPAPGWFTRLTGGYLEEMFAGIGGEVLFRPSNSRWGVGVELNRVYQREFEQRFGLQDDPLLKYQTDTGHVSLYYDSPNQNLSGQISLGRYLAEDIGGTALVSRLFESGIRVGGWFTLTDLSPEEFGEGSFDKGLFITIPFDLFYTRSTSQAGTFVFRPLTRDGGQMVGVPRRLIGVAAANDGAIVHGWGRLLE